MKLNVDLTAMPIGNGSYHISGTIDDGSEEISLVNEDGSQKEIEVTLNELVRKVNAL